MVRNNNDTEYMVPMTSKDSAAGVANHKFDQFSDLVLIMAAVFAFLPYFSVFGIHNFILKQYERGIVRVTTFIAWCVFLGVYTTCGQSDSCRGMGLLIVPLQYIIIALYVWAVVEGARVLQFKKQRTALSWGTGGRNMVQSSKPVMNVEDKSNSVPDEKTLGTVAKNEQYEEQDRKIWSVLSIMATIIPIMLWAYCLIVSGGSTSEDGPGAVWLFILTYYGTLGIPLIVLSIMFGVMGLKTSLRWLSIVSLLLKIITIIAVVLLLIVHWIIRPNLGY